MAAFPSANLKLDRAEHHLHDLDDEIAAYLDREPYKLVLNVQPSDQCTVLVEFHVIEQPPDHLGTIIGDCVHNLRSSLDHVICDLVVGHGGDCEHTQFPIPKEAPIDGQGKPKPIASVGGPIDPRALAIIDRLQPYHRGQGASTHPIALLRDLSNIDKHRTLHVVAAKLADTQCFLRFPESGTLLGGQLTNHVAYDQAPIGVFPFSEPFDLAANANVKVSGSGSAFVAIQEPGPWADRPVAPLLEEILQFLRDDVLLALVPFSEVTKP